MTVAETQTAHTVEESPAQATQATQTTQTTQTAKTTEPTTAETAAEDSTTSYQQKQSPSYQAAANDDDQWERGPKPMTNMDSDGGCFCCRVCSTWFGSLL